MRAKFSNRANDINSVAKQKGKTTSIDKNNIAQSIKRAKVHYDETELKMIWKSDAKSVGLNQDRIDSLKTFDPYDTIKNLKLEDELIKQSFSKNGKLFLLDDERLGLEKYTNWKI